MTEKRFCIICGDEFESDDPTVVICPKHGEPQNKKEPLPPIRDRQTPQKPKTGPSTGWKPDQVILDNYTVKAKLGHGGFGDVYRVHHNGWDIDLAVKRAINLDEHNKQTFTTEAEKWIALGLHPHIISCYYVRSIDDFPHTFAELAEGKSLHDWIVRDGFDLYEGGQDQALRRILDIAIQFAWGLAYAHDQGLVHQDVKPQNALMTRDGILKVTDFGLAKAGKKIPGTDSSVTSGGYTLAYRSPEQANRQRLTLKTDIWSWAVSLLEMFTGRVSWQDGQTALTGLQNYFIYADESPISQMPSQVEDLLRQCFQNEPTQRPENMHKIADQLIEVFTAETGQPYPREIPKAADLKADSLNNKALTMLDLGHENAAIENWKEALEEDPAHGEANLNYQSYLWRKAEITDDEMLANLAQVSGTNMDSPTFWKGMAELHAERGDWKEHKECLKKALQLNPALPVTEISSKIVQKATLKGHAQQVFPLQMNPAQDILASSGSDGSIRLWDIKTGRSLKVLNKAGFTTSLDFSPDGRELVSGSSDKTVKLWSVIKGRMLKQLKGHTDVVTSVAFSRDGQTIISGSLDGTVRVWERKNGRCIQEYKEHRHWVLSVQVPKEGSLALTAGRDQTVRLWQIQTGETVRVYDRPRSPRKAEYGRGCLKAGKVLWAGYDSLCLWDYNSGRLLTKFLSCQEKGAIDPYMTGDLTSDGHCAVTVGQNGEKRFWDTSSGRCIATLPSTRAGGSIIFGPGETLFCTAGKDIEVWQVSLAPSQHFYHFALSVPASSIVALEKQSKLKDRLETSKRYLEQGKMEKSVQILRSLQEEPEFKHDDTVLNQLAECAAKGQKVGLRECWMHSSYHLDKPEGTGGATALRFNSQTGMLAAGHRDGSVLCFDINARSQKCELQRHIGQVEAFSFLSPDSLLSLSLNGDLILWDLPRKTGQVVSTNLDDPKKGAHLSVLLAEDGQYVIAQGLRGYSRMPIHLDRLERLPERPYRPMVIRANPDLRMPMVMKDTLAGYVYQSAVSPDGTLFTSSLGDSRYGRGAHPVFVWEIRPGGITAYRRFTGHTNPVQTMTFSRDQTELITADLGGEIRIWDLPGNTCKRTIRQPSSQFTAVDCSPDSRFIIAGDSQGNLFVWDHAGKELLNIKPHRGKINTVAFSDNGRFAASGGFDNQIQVWEFDWDYQFPSPSDWDDDALPYLDIFLTRHQPLDPTTNIPGGKPVWSTQDLARFFDILSSAGFGWLRKDGVEKKLNGLARYRR